MREIRSAGIVPVRAGDWKRGLSGAGLRPGAKATDKSHRTLKLARQPPTLRVEVTERRNSQCWRRTSYPYG